jgi:hypothetical protein
MNFLINELILKCGGTWSEHRGMWSEGSLHTINTYTED